MSRSFGFEVWKTHNTRNLHIVIQLGEISGKEEGSERGRSSGDGYA
jgi:hypothetical protein